MSARLYLTDAKIGDTLILPFRFVDDVLAAIPQAGLIYELTISLDQTKDGASADYYQQQTIPPGAEADDGNIVFTIPASTTTSFVAASHFYELKQIIPASPENRVLTLVDGRVRFIY